MNTVKISRPGQYLHESQTWERALEFYRQENAFMKTRLSQVLDTHTEENFTETAEQFNNRFVLTDDLIASLLRDIRQQKELLQLSFNNNYNSHQLMDKYQQKLRSETEKFEKDFFMLRHDFNTKLLAAICIS